MLAVIAMLTLTFWTLLIREKQQAEYDRRRLAHVIHVNGIRGKSTVSRLIAAGLSAGGIPTYCKTTGTDPMTMDPAGKEQLIPRRGPSNIKEQLAILHQAAQSDAEVLVIECMAIDPELQRVSQERILQADIGILTNVRRDHTDVMGASLPEIADALSSTIPQDGVLFTAEQDLAPRLKQRTAEKNCRFVAVKPSGMEPDFDFAENIALALKVCEHLGVDPATALRGMKAYHRDPYALSIYQIRENLFVNALSANDPDSTSLIWQQILERYGSDYPRKVLILNNRADRPARTQDMLTLVSRNSFDEVFLLGAGQAWLRHQLSKSRPDLSVTTFPRNSLPACFDAEEHTIFFAAGNLAGQGRQLIDKIKKEGIPLV